MLRTEVKQTLKELKEKEIQQLLNGYFDLRDKLDMVDMALQKYAETIKSQDLRIQQLERKVRTTM